MSKYVPDSWVIVEINSQQHGKIQKVLAGWYGGYLYGESWKLNSGIEDVQIDGKVYNFIGHSGSVYSCYHANERLSGYLNSVYMSLEKDLKELGATIRIVPVEEFLKDLKEKKNNE